MQKLHQHIIVFRKNFHKINTTFSSPQKCRMDVASFTQRNLNKYIFSTFTHGEKEARLAMHPE